MPRTDGTVRQGSAITTGYLQDLIAFGKLPEGSEYLTVDPKKLFRAREKVMGEVQAKEEQEMQDEDITAVMVDSR
jgi:hypothetical protein